MCTPTGNWLAQQEQRTLKRAHFESLIKNVKSWHKYTLSKRTTWPKSLMRKFMVKNKSIINDNQPKVQLSEAQQVPRQPEPSLWAETLMSEHNNYHASSGSAVFCTLTGVPQQSSSWVKNKFTLILCCRVKCVFLLFITIILNSRPWQEKGGAERFDSPPLRGCVWAGRPGHSGSLW